MVTHMKTTVELSDHILIAAKKAARERSITLRSLIEESLAANLSQHKNTPQIKPITYKGKGLHPEFENASWDQIRDAIYS